MGSKLHPVEVVSVEEAAELVLPERVEVALRELAGAGVAVLAPSTDRPWGERTLHVADPDGNVVELTRPKRREP